MHQFTIFKISLFLSCAVTITSVNLANAGSNLQCVRNSVNTFTLNFARSLIQSNQQKNLAFSGVNIYEALMLLLCGSSGSTYAQLTCGLGLDQSYNSRLQLCAKVGRFLLSLKKNTTVSSSDDKEISDLSAGIFLQQDYPFLLSYKAVIRSDFKGASRNVNFRKDGDKAVRIINKFVSEATHGLINNFFTSNLPTNSIAALVACQYFKASWEIGLFPLVATGTFDNGNGQTTSVSYMSSDGKTNLIYVEKSTYSYVELPYMGEDYILVVILPKPFSSTDKVFTSITLKDIYEFGTISDTKKINVTMPQFKVNFKSTINDVLKNQICCIKDIFVNGQFDNMIDTSKTSDQFYVSDILHAVQVTVDKNGTEAVGTTGIIIGITAVESPSDFIQFLVDRPFITLIYDKINKVVLFSVVVYQPEYK